MIKEKQPENYNITKSSDKGGEMIRDLESTDGQIKYHISHYHRMNSFYIFREGNDGYAVHTTFNCSDDGELNLTSLTVRNNAQKKNYGMVIREEVDPAKHNADPKLFSAAEEFFNCPILHEFTDNLQLTTTTGPVTATFNYGPLKDHIVKQNSSKEHTPQ
jgi:hypothetical protein